MINKKIETQVVVIGSGPGGYSSAFRCADLGLKTVIVEQYSNLGGVCLNVGCIPSKSLLHIAKIVREYNSLKKINLFKDEIKIDAINIRSWKEKIVSGLNKNLEKLAKLRQVRIINGHGKFIDSHVLQVKEQDQITEIIFDNAVIATGSRPIQLSNIPYDDSRIWNSTDALSLSKIPNRLLIVGGGVIGLEIATIYYNFGTNIDIIEKSNQIIPSLDKDVTDFFIKNNNCNFNIMFNTEIGNISLNKESIDVSLINKKENSKNIYQYDAILIAVGRVPNSKLLNLDHIGIKIDKSDFICVDKQMRTNIPNIYAIGDVIGYPMLAHKSIYEGHIAAESIFGMKNFFDTDIIPSVAYTDPEIACVGMSEKEAKIKNIDFEVAIFPWSALGKAISSNIKNGMTKLIFEKNSNQLIGGAIVGENGSELLGEISLAIETNCDVKDISLTMHAHPTIYESIGLTAKIKEKTITDLIL